MSRPRPLRSLLAVVVKSAAAESAPSQDLVLTKFRVLDLRDDLVRGAEVSVVGLGEAMTDDNGYVELGLPYKDFFAVVIKFDGTEEITRLTNIYADHIRD